jgi:hypothetical protein
MKKNLLGLFAGVMAALLLTPLGSVQAQNFAYVGTGTSFNNSYTYPAPYGHYYWFSKHQMFVTAAELSAAGITAGSQISAFSFNVAGLNNMGTLYQWAVAIYTTTSTNPIATGMLLTGQVTNGGPPMTTYNPSLGWNSHTVTPFTWNGTDNFVVETCHAHIANFTSNASTYWETTLAGTSVKSRWYYQDYVTACQNSGSQGTSTTTRPNIRFEWAMPCTSTPGANAVMTPTFEVCPNSTVALGLANSYSVGSLTYQWYYSTTSAVGPFTPVPSGGTGSSYAPTVTANSWFQVQIGCPSASTVMASAGAVSVAATTTNSVPYFEGFETIGLNDRLPNCSWTASGLFTTTRTYTGAATSNRLPRTGTSFAAFTNTVGTHYYYTNGIWMEPGITYSASLWFTSDLAGSSNWSNLGILYGTSQSSTGLTPIVSTNGAAISPIHKSLSNTFTVSAPAFYYLAIRATAASGGAPFLSWDDLSVIIPCTPQYNPMNLAATTNNSVICSGSPVTLNASGAHTYLWSTGDTGPSATNYPQQSTQFSVIGTNTLTGCMSTAVVQVNVLPAPNVFAAALPGVSCAGKPVTLMANGANSYLWSNSLSGSVITVTLNATTNYTVIGTGANNCTGQAMITVSVNQNPAVSIGATSQNICIGEPLILTGLGAVTYNWYSGATFSQFQGSPVTVFPTTSGAFSVIGKDANGCEGSAAMTVNVEACTGISFHNADQSFRCYPNPATSEFVIESAGLINEVIVTDLTGRTVLLLNGDSRKMTMNISGLSNGIYHVRVSSDAGSSVIKMVKE